VRRFEEAGLGLYDGSLFGAPGHVRLNFACPRALLEQALARIAAAARRWSEGVAYPPAGR
jgi:cystathionine beta-lyase